MKFQFRKERKGDQKIFISNNLLLKKNFNWKPKVNKFYGIKSLYDWTISKIPQNRWGESGEISSVVSFLLSDYASYITGESINVDGGWLRS